MPEGSYIPSHDTPEGRQLVLDGKVDIPKDADVIGSVIAKLNPILDDARSDHRARSAALPLPSTRRSRAGAVPWAPW